MHYIICLLALLYCQTNGRWTKTVSVCIVKYGSFKAQKCFRATNGDRQLPNFVRPGGSSVPRFEDNPIQAIITSYKFDCCGVVTEWRAFVEGSGDDHFKEQPYTISFQVWRPNFPPRVNTDGCYTMQGTNHFSPISLGDPGTADRGIVTGVPLESERIEVQPGDVVGFYLESRGNSGDGIQFARDGEDESVWYTNATGVITDSGLTCPLPVGKGQTLSSFTNLAPLITVTVCKCTRIITIANTFTKTIQFYSKCCLSYNNSKDDN